MNLIECILTKVNDILLVTYIMYQYYSLLLHISTYIKIPQAFFKPEIFVNRDYN